MGINCGAVLDVLLTCKPMDLSECSTVKSTEPTLHYLFTHGIDIGEEIPKIEIVCLGVLCKTTLFYFRNARLMHQD